MKRNRKDDDKNEQGSNDAVKALLVVFAIFIVGFAFGKFSTPQHCSASSLTLSGKVLYNKAARDASYQL